MKQLNVQQLGVLMQARMQRRHQCFDKVVELCFTHIKRFAEKNTTFCFYEVPDFLIGYPLYDLNDCINYIIEKLQSNDFLVKYFFPRILYISWNVNEIKEEKLKASLSLLNALDGPDTAEKAKAPARRRNTVMPYGLLSATNTSAVPTKSVSFVKSVKEFKPSGKLVLDV